MNFFPWLAAFLSGMLIVSQAGAVAVKVETSSGEFVTGSWAGATASVVRLEIQSAFKEIPIDQIVALRPVAGVGSSTGPSMNVTLADGTSVFAQDIAMDDAVITIEPRRQSPIEMPIRQVRSIRFRQGGPTTDPQWLGMAEKDARSDLMVIRRGNEQLDPIEGVVVGLDSKDLQFELDGDKIEAPLERLEGVFFRSGESFNSQAKVKVTDIYGSTFLASRLEPSDSADSVEILLPGQIKHSVPIEQIKAITWASGRIMLSNAPPAASEMSPYLATKLQPSLMKDWFGIAADGEDLIATAGGKVEYRVDKGFQTLAGSVSRDELVSAAGTVTIRVLVDEEVKWEQSLTDAMAKGFRIPVSGARRVRLEVLAGDDGDVGDQVRFLKPRLLK